MFKLQMLRTRFVTRTQLARVTPFLHRSKPLTLSFAQCSSETAATYHQTQPHLRPSKDGKPPETGATTVAGMKMESLFESAVRAVDPSKSALPAPEASAGSDRRPPRLPEELSKNVVVLSCESTAKGGVCDVFVVGTCHVSEESCREVQAIVNFLKPQVVFLELCQRRVGALTCKEIKVPTVGEMITMLKKKHNIFSVLYSTFFAKVCVALKVRPGSEFQVAYEEAIKYGGRVVLGDRPIQITLRRTWSKMPIWHKTKLVCSLLLATVLLPSSAFLDMMWKESDDSHMIPMSRGFQMLRERFPTLMETLVHERDLYMSSMLLKVASVNSSVVAVVGRGHLQGIQKHWKQPVVLEDLLTVPSPKSSAKRIFKSVGVAAAGIAILSGVYLSCKN